MKQVFLPVLNGRESRQQMLVDMTIIGDHVHLYQLCNGQVEDLMSAHLP